MNKKILLGIILVLTGLIILFILFIKPNTSYNKLIISLDKWNSIISNRNMNTNIILEKIEFNDYELLIDNENSVIYYSIVDSNKKYNPSIKYLSNKKVNIVVNNNITNENLETDDLKIMLYDNNDYHIYTLVATKYPILNVIYKEKTKGKVDVNLELFDNHIATSRRVFKSIGKMKIIEENKEYSLSLIKESPGHNKRENHVSLFGMERRDEYIIRLAQTINEDEKYIQFFINNKYVGVYSLGINEKRGINNYERNKENNK